MVPPITETDTVRVALAVNTFIDSVAEKFPDGTIFVIRRDELLPDVDTVKITYFAAADSAKVPSGITAVFPGRCRALLVQDQTGASPFAEPTTISFHYFQPAPEFDEENFILGMRTPAEIGWVPVGGRALPAPDCIDAQILPADTNFFAVFQLEGISRTDEPVAAVIVQPNPFSPNGDGVCDITNITLQTRYAGNVDMDLFSVSGEHIRTLAQNMYVPEGRSENIIWDGTDENGNPCPMGIYILAVRFKYVFENNERWFRKNVGVVIVR